MIKFSSFFYIILFYTLSLNAADFSESFADLQWALKNVGRPQKIELDHMNSRQIPARSGEFINIKNRIKSDKEIIVAVLDTGIQKDHPDFKGKIVRKEKECQALEKFIQCTKEKDRGECEKIWMDLSNPEVDTDGNGYPLDCSGWSVLGGVNKAGILGRPDFSDDEGHGTHVAGIIAAARDNGVGIQGCSDNIKILPVQVLGKNPNEPIKPLSTDSSPLISTQEKDHKKARKTLSDLVARGVIYAIRSGAQVINFSMGWPQARDSELMRSVIAEAQSRGILVVAAAGNDSTRTLLRPCGYPGVICVASHGPDGALSHFTNYGSGVDLAAPGLNILSTWPESLRPIRFRSRHGYEFLHGTSQATPYVSCLAGEMLSRGYSPKEVYPRFILGTRPHKKPLKMVAGAPHETINSSQQEVVKYGYDKYTLSGNADFEKALSVKSRPLILPAQKEKIFAYWEEESIIIPIQLKNFWASATQVKVDVQVLKENHKAIRPEVVSVTGPSNSWKNQEQREFRVTLSTKNNPQMPSDFFLRVRVKPDIYEEKEFLLPVSILTPVKTDFQRLGSSHIKVNNIPSGRTSLLPVDRNLDANRQYVDYAFVHRSQETWTYHLASQGHQGDPIQKEYYVRGVFKLTPPEDTEHLREQISRMDYDLDGESDYVIELYDDKSEASRDPSPLYVYVLDKNFSLIEKFSYDSVKAQIPPQFNWMTYKSKKVPVWVGFGKDPNKKISLKELWENPQGYEEQEMRLYYLDEEHQLQAFEEYGGFRVVDILTSSDSEIADGIVSLLLARNQGSDTKPSDLYDFATAQFKNGEVDKFYELPFSREASSYQNLLNTRVDVIHSLNMDWDLSEGTFWFAKGKGTEQDISLLLRGAQSLKGESIGALRGDVDANLWVRSVYAGENALSVFSLSNSEIQYHDLRTQQEAMKSLERYTFYDDSVVINFHFPTTVLDSSNKQQKLPALYTTETSGFHKGVRFVVPHYDQNGELIELTSPARLRLEAQKGCRALDTHVWMGPEKGYYQDYFCVDKFIRIPLEY